MQSNPRGVGLAPLWVLVIRQFHTDIHTFTHFQPWQEQWVVESNERLETRELPLRHYYIFTKIGLIFFIIIIIYSERIHHWVLESKRAIGIIC